MMPPSKPLQRDSDCLSVNRTTANKAIDKCNELQHLNVLIDEIKAMESMKFLMNNLHQFETSIHASNHHKLKSQKRTAIT